MMFVKIMLINIFADNLKGGDEICKNYRKFGKV